MLQGDQNSVVRNMLRPLAAAIAAVIAMLLAGCQSAQISPYAAPSDANTARLLFRAKTAPGWGYGVYAFDDPHSCSKPLLIGRGNSAKSPDASALRAGPLATLQYFGADTNKRICRVIVSFYPVRQHTYVFATAQAASSCAVRVLDATDGENPRPIRMFRRTMQTGRGCPPLSERAASSEESTSSLDGQNRAEPSSSTRGLEELKDLLPTE